MDGGWPGVLALWRKKYVQALCYPIARGARPAGMVGARSDEVEAITELVCREGCLAHAEQHDHGFHVYIFKEPEVLDLIRNRPPPGGEDYHRHMGRLFGYSPKYIEQFIDRLKRKTPLPVGEEVDMETRNAKDT